MIHYHGTPCGGPRVDAARFLTGRHALVPFSYPDDVAIVADVCQSFVFDNGAFTVWKQGGRLDVDGYLKWVDEWHRHPGFDWALIPDVIDGDESENDKLLEQWPKHLAGVPVWHLHESTERLVRLATDWPRVALGSSGQFKSPGTEMWWQRINETMPAICQDGKPICKLHGLRMLDPAIFTKLPLASADSTNAAVNGGSISRFGSYPPPTKAQRSEVIAERIESFNSAATFTTYTQEDLWVTQ
jgi:hypothetical protein